MAWADPGDGRACKYVVAPWLNGWRVTCGDAREADFRGIEEAIDFACGLARERAYAGIVGIVVVEAGVKELHCFTPAPTARAPRLRLVATHGSARCATSEIPSNPPTTGSWRSAGGPGGAS
jgi:hypothetical protein